MILDHKNHKGIIILRIICLSYELPTTISDLTQILIVQFSNSYLTSMLLFS